MDFVDFVSGFALNCVAKTPILVPDGATASRRILANPMTEKGIFNG